MRMLIISHASFEKPGSIESWARRNHCEIQEISPYKGESLPDIKYYDFLVVMGGPQSPLFINESPYLGDEIELIKRAVQLHKRIVGVCLGAQLIGEALGAKTERSPHREVGMYPVELLKEAKDDPVFSHFPQQLEVMHWHSDMPGIAKGAVLLAKSEGCPRQAYRYGDNIYGFQCHFELTKPLVEEMIRHCPNDLKSGKYIMTADVLMSVDYAKMNSYMDKVLDH